MLDSTFLSRSLVDQSTIRNKQSKRFQLQSHFLVKNQLNLRKNILSENIKLEEQLLSAHIKIFLLLHFFEEVYFLKLCDFRVS